MDDLITRFETIARLVDEASLLLDAQSTVVAANQKALDLLGGHIAGYPLDRFLRHPDFAEAVRAANEDGKLSNLDYTRMEQVKRAFSLRIAPFEDGHVLLVIFDGTMMLSVERIRSDFVANVSHELRSPLTALSGFIETLQDGAVDDRDSRARFLAIMQTEAARMERLIDDLLSLSRVEADEHRAPRGEVDLLAMLGEMITAMAASAKSNEQKLRLTLAEDFASGPLWVQGDADELRQVFQNLVENAMRYGRTGSEIAVILSGGRLANGRERDDLIRVQVVNEGETIAPEHLGRLTERFYRVDKGRSREMGGTGLGLAIVKHIVNRHRGRMRITSQDGETTFSVTLRRLAVG